MSQYAIDGSGNLFDKFGSKITVTEVASDLVYAKHLVPHVVKFTLPKGNDILGIKVIYSSHCWTTQFDQNIHGVSAMIIRDGKRARVFDTNRYQQSSYLPSIFRDLSSYRVYLTPESRNFGVYSASNVINGIAYTAFFTLNKERGRLNAERHSIVLRVESAYSATQPSKGNKISVAAAVEAALRGRRLTYRD